jgi:hypothetical protein
VLLPVWGVGCSLRKENSEHKGAEGARSKRANVCRWFFWKKSLRLLAVMLFIVTQFMLLGETSRAECFLRK